MHNAPGFSEFHGPREMYVAIVFFVMFLCVFTAKTLSGFFVFCHGFCHVFKTLSFLLSCFFVFFVRFPFSLLSKTKNIITPRWSAGFFCIFVFLLRPSASIQ